MGFRSKRTLPLLCAVLALSLLVVPLPAQAGKEGFDMGGEGGMSDDPFQGKRSFGKEEFLKENDYDGPRRMKPRRARQAPHPALDWDETPRRPPPDWDEPQRPRAKEKKKKAAPVKVKKQQTLKAPVKVKKKRAKAAKKARPAQERRTAAAPPPPPPRRGPPPPTPKNPSLGGKLDETPLSQSDIDAVMKEFLE